MSPLYLKDNDKTLAAVSHHSLFVIQHGAIYRMCPEII